MVTVHLSGENAHSARVRDALDRAGYARAAAGEAEVTVLVHARPADDALAALAARGPHPDRPTVVVLPGPDAALRRAALARGAHEVIILPGGAEADAGALADAIEDARARTTSAGDVPRRAEDFALGVIDNLFAFVGVLAPDGTLIDANRAPLAAAGISLEDVRGQRFWDCYWWSYDPEVQAGVRAACERAARGEVSRYDVVVRMAGDTRMTIDFQLAPLRDEHGRITHLIPSAVDITTRNTGELALRASEARVRRLFETNLLGVLFWDLAGAIHDANDEFLRIVGYTRDDLAAGQIDWARMTPAEYKAQDARAVDELRAVGSHRPIEKEYVRKDGTRVWVLVGSAMLEGDAGVGFVLDISRAKADEAALRASDARAREAAARAAAERQLLDAVLESAPAAIIVAEATGKLVRFNPANALLWGTPPTTASVDEYQGWKGWWADASERRGRRLAADEWAMARALRGETVRGDIVEIEPFGRPGERRTIVNSSAPVRDQDGRITGAVVAQMDISALIEAEARRRASEAQFRALADNIAQLAWMTDETGYIHWFNRRWYEYTGTTAGDMEGWGWQAVHHPDHLERVLAKFRRHLAAGEPWEDTFPMRGADGKYRWFLSRAFPLRDDAGRIVTWFGTNTDVTAQREAEDALREADRRKDEFIAILAHELRNPLAPVRNAVELLKLLAPEDAALERARDVIDRQVAHMARLIDDLLDVSRLARGKLAIDRQTTDLAAVAAQTAEDYRSSFDASGVALAVVPAPAPVWVDGDPVRLAQMIGNLLHNACRFTERGGSVEVRVAADLANHVALLAVRDTGVGIAPGLLARLFDPFSQAEQDLARSKGGLGLGLALTKGLAELHGGGVSAASDGLGRGATFTLRLPLSRARYQATPDAPATPRAGAGLRILVVEDNRDAAETLGDLLGLAGHDVRLAYDGSEALGVAAEFTPDVVISDIGLPGALDGYGVARELRASPRLASAYLVALSGYANEEARRRSRDAGFDEHLAKPLSLAAIKKLLATRAPR